MIDVIEFVPLAKVDREYLEKVYYLGPDKGGDRAYRLLAAALKETGRAALGQYAARGQQHLVLLRPLNGVLVMEQLHYADEVRPTTEVTDPDGRREAGRADAREAAHRADGERRRSSPRSTRTRCASACWRRSSARSTARRSPPTRRRTAAARSSTSWKRSRRASHPRTRSGREADEEGDGRRREAARRDERLRLQGVEGLVLSRRSEGRRDARLLRRASFRRSRSTTRSTGCRRSTCCWTGRRRCRRRSRSRSRRASASRTTRGSSRSARARVEFLLKNTVGARRPARPDPLSAAAEPQEGCCRGCARFSARCRPTGSTRSSFDTRAGSTTTSSTRCASATSRCASPSSRSSRRRSSRPRRGDMRGCTGSTTTRPRSPSGRAQIAAQPWSEAYVFFKHDEGTGSGPPAVSTFTREFDRPTSG